MTYQTGTIHYWEYRDPDLGEEDVERGRVEVSTWPWQLPPHFAHAAYIQDAEGKIITGLLAPVDLPESVREANLRLLQAAPEMADLLLQFRAAWLCDDWQEFDEYFEHHLRKPTEALLDRVMGVGASASPTPPEPAPDAHLEAAYEERTDLGDWEVGE